MAANLQGATTEGTESQEHQNAESFKEDYCVIYSWFGKQHKTSSTKLLRLPSAEGPVTTLPGLRITSTSSERTHALQPADMLALPTDASSQSRLVHQSESNQVVFHTHS
jgi:hypothetical protein